MVAVTDIEDTSRGLFGKCRDTAGGQVVDMDTVSRVGLLVTDHSIASRDAIYSESFRAINTRYAQHHELTVDLFRPPGQQLLSFHTRFRQAAARIERRVLGDDGAVTIPVHTRGADIDETLRGW